MADKKTPLYSRHIELGGNVVNFGGYLLPTQYAGIKQEHNAVRAHAGLFDVSHMGEFIVSGKGAESFLQKMTINDVSTLSIGQAQYSAMCYENGGIVDDLLIYKKESEFMLVVNAANLEKDYNWLKENAPEEVYLQDISTTTGLVALQGPKSRDILQSLTESNLSNIQFYHFIEGKLGDVLCVISRTGYSGELGFEIYADANHISEIWDSIMKAGEGLGIEPCGLGARDTLRMEMKYALYGNDIHEKTNPVEAGLGWITKLNKADFIGRDAIVSAKEIISRRLVCLEMTEKAIPRKGCPILKNDQIVGEITSGTMSPSLGKGIGIGFVDIPFHKSGSELFVDIRGRKKSGIVVKPPFYKSGSLLD